MRTLGRKRAVKRKSFLMFRRNDRSLSRPRLRSATLPEGEGFGRHTAKFQFILGLSKADKQIIFRLIAQKHRPGGQTLFGNDRGISPGGGQPPGESIDYA